LRPAAEKLPVSAAAMNIRSLVERKGFDHVSPFKIDIIRIYRLLS